MTSCPFVTHLGNGKAHELIEHTLPIGHVQISCCVAANPRITRSSNSLELGIVLYSQKTSEMSFRASCDRGSQPYANSMSQPIMNAPVRCTRRAYPSSASAPTGPINRTAKIHWSSRPNSGSLGTNTEATRLSRWRNCASGTSPLPNVVFHRDAD